MPRSFGFKFMRRALEKSGDQQLGRPRGGFGTKIHAACDGLGNPVKFLLTPGQTHDITQAATLLKGLAAEQVIADKGYDGDQVLQTIHDQGGHAVIPPKSNRNVQRPYDKGLYRERNHICDSPVLSDIVGALFYATAAGRERLQIDLVLGSPASGGDAGNCKWIRCSGTRSVGHLPSCGTIRGWSIRA